jgi:hypothetical protein
LYVQGQVARFVHPSNGSVGASVDKNRFLPNSCATVQLAVFASTLIACHFFGMFAGRVLLRAAGAWDCPTRRFKLELIGVEWVCCRRNMGPPFPKDLVASARKRGCW